MLETLQDWLALLILVYTAVSSVGIWVIRRASKEEVIQVSDQVKRIEKRVTSLEDLGKLLPTREDLHLLRLDLLDTQKEMGEWTKVIEHSRTDFVARMDELRKHMDTQVERTERMLGVVTQHLLDKGK